MTRLRASTFPLSATSRSSAETFFHTPTLSIEAEGVAAVIEVERGRRSELAERTRTVLASIDHDSPGAASGPLPPGPLALGALPFDPDAPARLVVPRTVEVRLTDGRAWRTVVEGGETGAAGSPTAALPRPPGMPLRVGAPLAEEDWCAAVAEARKRIRGGELAKVVLAREVIVETAEVMDPPALARRLPVAPQGYRFCIDGFVGASPELLVSRDGEIVRARPMAGTTRRGGDPSEDATRAAELLASTKDRAEHQLTIDMVLDTLLDFCSFADSEPQPSVVAAGSVAHLASFVEGRLSAPPASVLELVHALHPTPAVCGVPREAALALIAEVEHLERGRYAGPVGWVDAAGNGEWAVGIRSAEISGRHARVFAGVGVVADSDPLRELDETRAKLQAMLDVLTP